MSNTANMSKMNGPETGDAPRLSVIVPTMGSLHLEEIVGRLLAESVPAEIIVMVDAPDLDCRALLPGFAGESRLRIVQNAENIGLTRSLNRAVEAACGEIIVRNDDDDIPAADRLAKTLAFFDAHPECDLVYAFATGRDEGSGAEWLIDGPVEDAAIKEKLLQRNFIVHSTLAFRKASLASIDWYDATFRYAQDYDLYLRSMRHGLTFGCIPERLITRIYHDRSITVSRRRRQMLFSFAARLIHHAQADDPVRPWPTILGYAKLLLIPDWLRALRRRLGHGR